MSAIAIDMSPRTTLLKLYLTLARIKRKLLDIMIWFCTNKTSVFPSLATLAKKVGCCPSYVSEVLTEFEQMGWIKKKHRPNQSNVYEMPEELLNLNLKCTKTFDRKKSNFTREKSKPESKLVNRVKYSYPKYSCYSAEKARIAWKAAEKTAPNTNFEDLDDQTQNDLKIVYPKELIEFVLDKIDWYRKQPGKVVDKFVGLMKFLCDKHLKEFC